MKFFSKPQNRWGWVRAAGVALLAGVLLWVLGTALLRGPQSAPWMDGLEIALALLLVVIATGWLEAHDARVAHEQSRQREAEEARAAQRKATLTHLQEALQAELHAGTLAPGSELPVQARLRIHQAIRAALAELDGKGKGELLHVLFEMGLLASEKPLIDGSGADLRGATLHKAHLEGANLTGCDLSGAQLNGARLARAKLAGADLSKAFLRHADLWEADLSGCNLTRARLEHANLEGADLREARLAGAFLNHANLKAARFDGSWEEALLVDTILPDGRKLTNAKGKDYLEKKEIATLVDRL